jgi:hypothetical protein
MGRFRKAITSAIKKVMGSSSKRSCASSSSRYTEREESPMQEDEENEPTEDQGQSVEEDEPYLDLERGREMVDYHLIKDREFEPTPMYNPALLQAIGMDNEFTSIWQAVGWEEIDPLFEEGSRLLTIQFLCSLKEIDNGITFRLSEVEYFCTWRVDANHIGFNQRCQIELDHVVTGFDRHRFWNEILGQVVVGKFSPINMDIQHPTLRFMHHWIAMTIFSRQDIQVVHNAKMKVLYAMIRKIKIAPVKEIFNHWLEVIKTFTTTLVTCTSLVTCIANGVGALQNQQIEYITTPRLIIDEHYLIQGHHLKHNPVGEIVFFFPGHTNEI